MDDKQRKVNKQRNGEIQGDGNPLEMERRSGENELYISQRVFTGVLSSLPELGSSVVRVFLSSTFTDMQAERNWLMKYSIPHLRKYCQGRGLDFQIADMRWGVRDEATADHKTTELCLQEIVNCQKMSRGPNFVCFLGDKYGYRPIPTVIEETEFKLLKTTALKQGHDTTLLVTWYMKDENMQPVSFLLQPITAFLPHFTDFSPLHVDLRQQAQREWWAVSDKLTRMLRDAADQLCHEDKMSKERRHVYYQSVTETEVATGILQARDVNNRALCFMRTLIEMDINAQVAGRYTDLADGKLDLEAEELRERLRLVMLPAVLDASHMIKYNVTWEKNGINVDHNVEHIRYVEQFGKDFVESMEKLIDTELERNSSKQNPLFEEVLHHLHFCHSKCETFCGREDILEEIKSKLSFFYGKNSNNATKGKAKGTALENGMSESDVLDDSENKAAETSNSTMYKRLEEEYNSIRRRLKSLGIGFHLGDKFNEIDSDPNHNVKAELTKMPNIREYTKPVIVHGVSGSGKTAVMAKVMELSKEWFPACVSIIRFLATSTMSTSIREVIVSICLQVWQTYKVQKPVGFDLDTDFHFLMSYFTALLWKIDTTSRPLVIILDSVDQLSSTDHAHMFNWLPQRLPPGVHFLISMATDHNNCVKNVCQVILQEQQYIKITSMADNTANNMITALCNKADRYITRRQRKILQQKFMFCKEPLYLKLLTDNALSWKSYTEVNSDDLGNTMTEAIDMLFDELEKNHGQVLIQRAFAYLCGAREGLSDPEMEDLLSLDDAVLQDSYVYHLPPDPEAVRLPPLLWRRVRVDIAEYLVQRQSGGKQVLAWYHRQFSDAARDRYFKEECRAGVHACLAEYFQGIWSSMIKGLQLIKGKKGDYPKAMRQVPAQPIKFGPNIYNTRKLSELPFHLIHSRQFHDLLKSVFSDPEWLYAKCLTMSLTSLMEDFRLAIQAMESRGIASEAGILNCVRLISRIVLLSSDSVRKHPVFLPVQILSQLGPHYKGTPELELLVHRALDWCRDSPVPLLLPRCRCMPTPGGTLLYTIEVDVSLAGEKRDGMYRCMFLRDDLNHLFVTKQQSRTTDQLCVFDIHDNGSCIITDDVHHYIRAAEFVGNNKYLLLDIYQHKEEYNAVSSHRLYASSTSSPLTFPHPPKVIVVSQTGKYVAYSSANRVYICRGDKGMKQVHTIQEHSFPVVAVLISPDESLLVTKDNGGQKDTIITENKSLIMVFDLKKKKFLRILEANFDITNNKSQITKQNVLICSGSGYKEQTKLKIVDLMSGELVHEIQVYQHNDVDLIRMHPSDNFTVVGTSGTVVINGVKEKFAEIRNIKTGEKCGLSPVNGPYRDIQIFGKDRLFYATCGYFENDVTLLFAGTVTSPLSEAVVMHRLIGHNQPIIQVVVSPRYDKIFSASMDNTIKVWDLKTVVESFVAEITRIEKTIGYDADLPDIVSKYRIPDWRNENSQTTNLVIDRTGETVNVGTNTGRLIQYDVQSGTTRFKSELSVESVQHMLLSRNGRYILIGGGDKIHVEDLHKELNLVLTARGEISCMAEANNRLIAGTQGMSALGRVWNIETGDVLKDIELLYSFYCVAINSLGNTIVSTLFDFPVVMNLESDVELAMDPEKMDTMMSAGICVVISPDDKLAASSSADGAVRVIQMTGKYLFRMQQRSSAVALAFTMDSTSLLSAGYRSIYVWSTTDGSLRYKLTRHLDFVTSLKFDPTGRFLVTVSRDKQLVLWDFRKSISMATFQTHCQVICLDVSHKAKTIAYIPESLADVAIIQGNTSLKKLKKGEQVSLNLAPTAQAVALSFSGQRLAGPKPKSLACVIL